MAFAMDGAAAITMMNRIAEVFSPNKMIANGIQADDGADDQGEGVADEGPFEGVADRVPQQARPRLVPQVGQGDAGAGQDELLPAGQVDKLPDDPDENDGGKLRPDRRRDARRALAGAAARTGAAEVERVEPRQGGVCLTTGHGGLPPRGAGR